MKLQAVQALLGTLTISLVGCASGPDFQPPAAPQHDYWGAPAAEVGTFTASGPDGATQRLAADLDIPARWWEQFRCKTLDARVHAALTNSPTLAQAMARLQQAQEEFNAQAGSVRYPSVDAGLSATRQKVNPSAMGIANIPAPDPFNLFSASVNVSYAFDLFGRNRRILEARQAQVDRKAYELVAARQTLAANVVMTSIRLAEAEEQLNMLREVVIRRKQQLEIATRRMEAGGISARDLEAQHIALAQAQAALPTMEDLAARLQRQLGVYLGREPAEVLSDSLDLKALHLPQEVPTSLPSAIARQRPDIRAAEALWQQANASLGVATADLYPQITLTGSLGMQQTDITDILEKANVWSIGAGLMQPLFHGGALRARKRGALAARDEAAAAYRDTVLRGLQEVADVMGALERDARVLAARTAAAQHAQTKAEITRQQVQLGGLSQTALLDEEIGCWQAEGERLAAQAARLADTAALFHALGGSWRQAADQGP